MPSIAATPFPYEFPAHGLALMVIDMQRDFLEPGGFGEALGNNVAPLAAIIYGASAPRSLPCPRTAHYPYERSPSP